MIRVFGLNQNFPVKREALFSLPPFLRAKGITRKIEIEYSEESALHF